MPAGRSSGAARSFCGLVLVRKRLADGSYGWPKIPAFRAGRRAPLRYPAPPWPAGIRRPYGGRPGAQNGWGGHGGRRRFGGRGGGGPAPPPPPPKKKKGPRPPPPPPPPALSGRFAPSRRPPPGRYDLHQGQKATKRPTLRSPQPCPAPLEPRWNALGPGKGTLPGPSG